MKQKKYTKRALCMSILSMLLCCSMLIGTTFAWFTDSVTSGRNQIVAGNLDVELYHTNANVKDEAKVTEDTKLFQNSDGTDIQWEPGVIAYENFTVKNVGTLALKYELTLSVYGENATTAGHSLSEVIKVAFIEGTFDPATGRDGAQGQTYGELTDTVKSGTIEPKGTDAKFAVVLYWEPSADDDLYNLKNGLTTTDGEPLWIDLGVNLHATQTPHESDSFGKDYDDGLELPKPLNATVFGNVGSGATPQTDSGSSEEYYHVGNDTISVDIPTADLTHGETRVYLVVETTGTTENSYDLDISLENQNHEVIATDTGAKMYRVNVNIGAGRLAVKAFHEGKAMNPGGSWDTEGYTYNEFTGVLTLYVAHFSPFEITWYVPTSAADRTQALDEAGYTGINSIQNTTFTSKSKKVYLRTKDQSWTAGNFSIKKDTIIDLNENTLSVINSRGNGIEVYDCNAIIRNGTIVFGSNVTSFGIGAFGSAHITLENCTIQMTADRSFALATNGADSLDSVVTLRNCKIVTPHGTSTRGYSAYIPAGTFTFENCEVTGHMAIAGGSVTIDGGTYTATGFNGQNKIWNKDDTISYMKGIGKSSACNMGDCILIMDRRSTDGNSYLISDVTIKNATFHTSVEGIGTLYAVKYVDMKNNDGPRAKITVKNNTYIDKIDNQDPVMFTDIDGNDIRFN